MNGYKWIIGLFVALLPVLGVAQCDDDDPPTGSISTSEVGCGGGTIVITFSLDGDDDEFDVVYRIGGSTFTLQDIEDGHTVSHFVSASTTATLVSVTERDDDDDDECTSTINQTIPITVPLPPNLSVSSNNPDCNQNSGSITAQASGGQSPYQFRLNSGAFQSNGTFSNLGAGSYTITVRDASGCEASRSVNLTAGAAPNLTISNTSQPGCNQNNGSITAQASGGQSPYQFRLNSGAFQSNGTFSNLGVGSYTITVRDASGCEASRSVTLQNPAGGLAAASITGGDIELCPDASRIITGNLPAGATGRWTADSDAVRFTNTNNRSTTVTTTQSAIYTLTWTLSAPGCANYSSASVELIVLTKPVATDDGIFAIPNDTTINLPVLDNDRFDGAIQISILTQPNQGMAQVLAGNIIRLQTLTEAAGEDRFTYQICLLQCTGLCDTATVRLIIEEEGICNLEKIDPRVIFPEGITPNGDGYNEALEFKIVDKIGCPTNYAQSDISIFNRWGDRVFYQEPYENGWYGTTDDGKELPPGVYYYTLRVRRSGKKDYVRFGNVTIFRQ